VGRRTGRQIEHDAVKSGGGHAVAADSSWHGDQDAFASLQPPVACRSNDNQERCDSIQRPSHGRWIEKMTGPPTLAPCRVSTGALPATPREGHITSGSGTLTTLSRSDSVLIIMAGNCGCRKHIKLERRKLSQLVGPKNSPKGTGTFVIGRACLKTSSVVISRD
jgi:hypothetical protein